MGENWLIGIQGRYLAVNVKDSSSFKTPVRFSLLEAQFLARTIEKLGVEVELVNKMHVDIGLPQYRLLTIKEINR